MARNRKRAKERRARRPATGPVSRPGVATARTPERDGLTPNGTPDVAHDEIRPDVGHDEIGPDVGHDEIEEAPSPIEHAAPDVELAEAQLALGRPELAGDADGEAAEPEDFDEDEEEELEEEALASGPGRTGGGPGGQDLEPASAPHPERRFPGSRLINFLQGSWRELQRVQWPDRRQVMQATGVVIGFVIVAGIFLGIADEIAGKLVTLILK